MASPSRNSWWRSNMLLANSCQLQSNPRPGDIAGAYANADKAKRLLGWKAEKSIEEGIADALKWGKVRDTIIHY